MPRRDGQVSALVTLLVLLPAIAACSGANAEGDTGRPRQTAAQASASSPTYVPPTVPPEPVPTATPDRTVAGIFVLAWFETLNYGFATGDADPLRASVGLGCFTCANWIIEVQTQADEGLAREGGYVHVRDLVYLGPEGDDFLFRARLDRDPGTLTTADGSQTALAAGSGEVVDLRVGVVTSSLTDSSAWSMKAITAPAG